MASYIAIAICRYNYVDLELEDQIFGEINYPPLHSVLKGDIIFHRGPNISEIFALGVQIFYQYNYLDQGKLII